MNETISLSEARKNLPELADKAHAGRQFVLARRGRQLAVLVGIDEYRRLKAIEQQQRQRDFDTLLAPPESKTFSEAEANQIAVQIVRHQRAK